MIKKIIKKSYIIISLAIFAALILLALSASITGQPSYGKVYTVNDKKIMENSFTKKISQLNLNTATNNDLIELFGEPQEYFWGDNTYTRENLPDYYYMKYSDCFDAFIIEGKIVQIRILNPSYTLSNYIKVGSGISELKKSGLPLSIEKYEGGPPEDGILYTLDGITADRYSYSLPDKRVTLYFSKSMIIAIYISRIDKDSIVSNYTSKDDLLNLPNRVFDKTDYPFDYDPEVIGTWKAVNFVKEIKDFSSEKTSPIDEFYLKKIIFYTDGRCKYPSDYNLEWTRGIVIDDKSHTASKYTIKDINGSKYMFVQWKSADYILSGMKPYYYVMKKVNDCSDALKLEFGVSTLNDAIKLVGEPSYYQWGDDKFTKDNLPDQYLAFYDDGLSIYISKGLVEEVRFITDSVEYKSIRVGSTIDEVFKAVGQPLKTEVNTKPALSEDKVFYKDLDGVKGRCYYLIRDKGLRLFLEDNKVCSLFVFRPE